MFEAAVFFISSLLCFGTAMATFALKVTYYLKEPERWKYWALLFIGYLIFYIGTVVTGHFLTFFTDTAILFNVIRLMQILLLSVFLIIAPFLVYKILGINGCMKGSILVVCAVLYTAGSLYTEFVLPVLWISIVTHLVLVGVLFWVLLEPMIRFPSLSNARLNFLLKFLISVSLVFLPLLSWEKILGVYESSLRYQTFLLFFLFFICLADCIYLITELSHHEPQRHRSLADLPQSFFTGLGLTQREVQVVVLVETGLSYKEIGSELAISANTVGNHVVNIYRKIGAGSKTEMLRIFHNKAASANVL